jgi:hypothetical protein
MKVDTKKQQSNLLQYTSRNSWTSLPSDRAEDGLWKLLTHAGRQSPSKENSRETAGVRSLLPAVDFIRPLLSFLCPPFQFLLERTSMTENIPAFIAPAFAVFENRKATTPIFLAAGIASKSAFQQATAFARGYNGDRQTAKAIVRRASARVIFGQVSQSEKN